MIDFRYHVVSLVSVFMALAVGIVLGAGPLNEGISTGITDQVNQLTSEKNQLRTQRDAALATVNAQDSWAQAVGPALVAHQLEGRAVVVVELPGANSGQLDSTVDQLRSAGATVSARVTLQQKWIAADRATFRGQLATQLSGELSDTPAGDSGTEVLLAAELARAVVTTEPTQIGQPDTQAATIISALSDGGLVKVDGDIAQRGTLAVVVGGAPDAEQTDDQTDDQASQAAAAWVALATQLDRASAGAVLAGPTGSAQDGGAVAAVRADSDAPHAVSTVDDLDLAMGQINVVLALRQQLSGNAGQYGTAGSATAVVPPSPVAAS
ncbi:MAG: copper transporter [Janthinobacterium lividum]